MPEIRDNEWVAKQVKIPLEEFLKLKTAPGFPQDARDDDEWIVKIRRWRDQAKEMSEQLVRSFTYHAPKGDQAPRYERLRAQARELAELVHELCPDSREKSLAITRLEEAVMWANKSIACNEGP